MYKPTHSLTAIACALGLASTANAAFVVEVDIDGLDDAAVTPSPNFSFGGDTTAASSSVAVTAPGLTGGDSIFGGNGAGDPDTYLYSYTPGTDADNFSPAPGTALNQNLAASGIAGGATDTYAVWTIWPETTNVSGGLTTYELFEGGVGGTSVMSVSLDQNTFDGRWVRLGYADLTAGTEYVLAQTSGSNTFVSMRAAAAMFEVPEPGTAALLGLGGLAMLKRRTA